MGKCNLESLKKNILQKFTSAYLHQITIEINSSPINNLHDKGSQKVKTAHMLKMSKRYIYRGIDETIRSLQKLSA